MSHAAAPQIQIIVAMVREKMSIRSCYKMRKEKLEGGKGWERKEGGRRGVKQEGSLPCRNGRLKFLKCGFEGKSARVLSFLRMKVVDSL